MTDANDSDNSVASDTHTMRIVATRTHQQRIQWLWKCLQGSVWILVHVRSTSTLPVTTVTQHRFCYARLNREGMHGTRGTRLETRNTLQTDCLRRCASSFWIRSDQERRMCNCRETRNRSSQSLSKCSRCKFTQSCHPNDAHVSKESPHPPSVNILRAHVRHVLLDIAFLQQDSALLDMAFFLKEGTSSEKNTSTKRLPHCRAQPSLVAL